MSIEPFNRLVKLSARAFYEDYSTKGENQPKNSRSDNRGMAVVILDALTRRQWVREEDLAKDLKIHLKQLRRTLQFFHDEKLVMRDLRRETAKGVSRHAAAVAATSESHHYTREGEEKIKLHTHSYCCLDYAQIYDVVRYRIHRMKKKLKDELDSKNTIQEYICPNCGKRYTALDAARLISMEDDSFHCESCDGELVAESDKLAAQDVGDADDNARRRRREKLKEMLQKIEEQLKPVVEQLNRVKDLKVPEYGTLHDWEARNSAAARAAGDNPNDPSRGSQGGTPMPFVGDPKVEVAFSGLQVNNEDSKAGIAAPMKVLPPWMIKQGMNLTKEQRGEVKEEQKMDGSSTSAASLDDKKSNVEKDDNSLQDEYAKAYYAALYKLQQEQEEAARKQQEISSEPVFGEGISSDRQVGMKSKRDDEDDDVEWEEAAPSGNSGETLDLNVEADPAAEEDDDDVEWEEG